MGRVQLGPLGTAANNRPIEPAPGDYDDGETGGMIVRGNRSTRRKPAPVPLCPPQNPTCCPDANPGRRGGKPATNGLSYGTASIATILPACLPACLPVGATALGEPWPPLQPVSTVRFLNEIIFLLNGVFGPMPNPQSGGPGCLS
jgi:hypothetical protein